MHIFKIYKDGPILHCFLLALLFVYPVYFFQYYYMLIQHIHFICLISSIIHPPVLCSLSCVHLFVALRPVAHQAPLSVGILQARILEWVARPTSRGRPNPRIEPRSPALRVDSLSSCHQGSP